MEVRFLKKLLILTFIFLFALQGVGLAAKGGSFRAAPAAPKSAPLPPAGSSKSAPAPSSDYKPSAPASSYKETAPNPGSNAAANPASPLQRPNSSGGLMRGLGLFGGGMLLGSLFGGNSMLGGLGFLGDLVFLVLILLAGRFLWSKFKGSQNNNRRS